jgi:hypothetical protein
LGFGARFAPPCPGEIAADEQFTANPVFLPRIAG